MKKFKALPMLVVEYKKTNDHKTMYKGFQSSEKIFFNNWDIYSKRYDENKKFC